MSPTGGTTGLSWNVADDVRQLLSQHFMVNALAAGTIESGQQHFIENGYREGRRPYPP